MTQFQNPLAPKRNRFQAKSSDIKSAVREVLNLPSDTPISIAELACRDEGCPDLETVIGVMEPGKPIKTYSVHLPISDIVIDDLADLLIEKS